MVGRVAQELWGDQKESGYEVITGESDVTQGKLIDAKGPSKRNKGGADGKRINWAELLGIWSWQEYSREGGSKNMPFLVVRKGSLKVREWEGGVLGGSVGEYLYWLDMRLKKQE